jgi:chemotaxis protein MotA
MGLIQVMKHLENIDEVGKGIAIAFVATVYGVAVANLFLLPAAAKLKTRASNDIQIKELLLEGVSGILEGMNPKLIRTKLEAFVQASAKKTKAAAEKSGAGAPAEASG